MTIRRAEQGSSPSPGRCSVPRCSAPVPVTTQRCLPGHTDPSGPQLAAPGCPAASHIQRPLPTFHPSPGRSGTVTKWAAGIVIRCCKFSPFEQYFCVFLCLCQGWESESSGRQKLAWQAKSLKKEREKCFRLTGTGESGRGLRQRSAVGSVVGGCWERDEHPEAALLTPGSRGWNTWGWHRSGAAESRERALHSIDSYGLFLLTAIVCSRFWPGRRRGDASPAPLLEMMLNKPRLPRTESDPKSPVTYGLFLTFCVFHLFWLVNYEVFSRRVCPFWNAHS